MWMRRYAIPVGNVLKYAPWSYLMHSSKALLPLKLPISRFHRQCHHPTLSTWSIVWVTTPYRVANASMFVKKNVSI